MQKHVLSITPEVLSEALKNLMNDKGFQKKFIREIRKQALNQKNISFEEKLILKHVVFPSTIDDVYSDLNANTVKGMIMKYYDDLPEISMVRLGRALSKHAIHKRGINGISHYGIKKVSRDAEKYRKKQALKELKND